MGFMADEPVRRRRTTEMTWDLGTQVEPWQESTPVLDRHRILRSTSK